MRTTLTLDDDVAEALRRLVRQTGRPFKQVVNDALRAGLAPQAPVISADVSYPTYPMGANIGVNMDRARHLAAELEDDEIARKLELRK